MILFAQDGLQFLCPMLLIMATAGFFVLVVGLVIARYASKASKGAARTDKVDELRAKVQHLRDEVVDLRAEVQRLRDEIERLKKGPGQSTGITS